MEKMSLYRIRATDGVETYIAIRGGWSAAYDVAGDLSQKMRLTNQAWSMTGLDFMGPLSVVSVEDLRSMRSNVSSPDELETCYNHAARVLKRAKTMKVEELRGQLSEQSSASVSHAVCDFFVGLYSNDGDTLIAPPDKFPKYIVSKHLFQVDT